MPTADERAQWLADIDALCRCERCRCLSCEHGVENHAHVCTDAPDCRETRERLRSRARALRIALLRARLMLREASHADR